MNFTIVLKEEALKEIQAAFEFYECKKAGLGIELEFEIIEQIKTIESNPYLFEEKHAPYREARIKRFPYLLIYEIMDDEIVVYAVFHTSRSQEGKYKK